LENDFWGTKNCPPTGFFDKKKIKYNQKELARGQFHITSLILLGLPYRL